MSTRLLRTRPARVVPAVILAIVLLLLATALGWIGVAAIVATGTIDSAMNAGYPGLDALGTLNWGAAAVIGVGVVLAVLGLVFVIAGISPGARRLSDYRAEPAEHIGRFEVALPTSALSNLAAAAADSVDGVSSVRAASNAKSTIVTFSTPVRDNAPIRDEVEAAVRERFESISFDRTPTVKVHALRRQA